MSAVAYTDYHAPDAGPRPGLVKFVVLSVLLHALILILFADAAGKGQKRVGVLWGRMNVALQKLAPERGSDAGLKLSQELNTRGSSLEQLTAPGSESVAPSAPPTVPPITPPPVAAAPSTPPPAAAVPPTVTPPPSPPPTAAPRPDPGAVKQADRPAPKSVRRFDAAPLEPMPAPRADQEIAKPVDLPPVYTPPVPRQLEAITLPKMEREFIPPTELPPRYMPVVPAPLEAIKPSKLEQEFAAPAELPPRYAPPVQTPIEPIAPSKIEREFAQPTELPPRYAPAVPPAIAPLAPVPSRTEQFAQPTELPPRYTPPAATPLEPLAPAAPAAVERQFIQPSELKLPPAETARPATEAARPASEAARPASDAAAPASSAATPSSAAAQPSTPAAPRDAASAPASVPRDAAPSADALRQTAPGATADPRSAPPGRDAASSTAPSTEPGKQQPLGTPGGADDLFGPSRDVLRMAPGAASPRIDLDAARNRAREIASESRRGVFAIPGPPKPEHKSKEQLAFEKALKEPDCRNAYADMGLLAIAPLLWSSIAPERKCKW